MKRLTALLIALLLTAPHGVAAAGQQAGPAEDSSLRTTLEARFDIVPLTNGVGLRPKTAGGDVRLIEVTDGSILVNGAPVSGQELRQRLGADADAVLRVSYLTAAARRALIEPRAGAGAGPDRAPPAEPLEPVEPAAPDRLPPIERDATPEADAGPSRAQRSSGDRVRIFGNVHVREDEAVSGQVVAVLGSVRIDGEVGDQVVAVLGSVDLGPKAVIRGDVVSVGGRVRRADGARIRGGVTEVSVADPNVHVNFEPLFGWGGGRLFDPFSAFPRLIGSLMRLVLLVLLVFIVVVIARPTVEASAQRVSDSPVQTTLIGVAAQVLLIPMLVLTAIVLAISIIGIPLLLFMPFVILALVLLALAGFSGTVYAVGQGTRRRMGIGGGAAPFLDVLIGVVVILLPVLVARLFAFGGWGSPLVIMLLAVGFTIEFLAWSSGFGAVLSNGFSRWQSRRVARAQPPMVP